MHAGDRRSRRWRGNEPRRGVGGHGLAGVGDPGRQVPAAPAAVARHASASDHLRCSPSSIASRRGSAAWRGVLGRINLFPADDEDTTRSAAGRAALEAVYTPGSLLPQRGVTWRAESESEIVAAWDVPPERPKLHLEIDDRGALRSYCASRWGDMGQKTFGYIPCGCEVRADRRFGELVVPSSVTGAWWFGTPRQTPFSRAEVRELAAVR
jgi:hypothetical protein